MVTKIKALLKKADWQTVVVGLLGGLMFTIGGCYGEQRAQQSYARAAPVQAHSPLILSPGQTAVLLEDVQAIARIPYQGDELHSGPVVFQKGSMVVKPKVE